MGRGTGEPEGIHTKKVSVFSSAEGEPEIQDTGIAY